MARNRPQDLRQKARNYAFLLLKYRLRSEHELYERLKAKKFPEEIIQETVASLKDKRFIDDVDFAKAWIESRLKKPLGFIRLRQELRAKGVDRQVIDRQIQAIKENYSEEDTVCALARQRFMQRKVADPLVAKRRLYAYLLRRGFSSSSVSYALEKL